VLVSRQRSATIDERNGLPLEVESDGPRHVVEADVEQAETMAGTRDPGIRRRYTIPFGEEHESLEGLAQRQRVVGRSHHVDARIVSSGSTLSGSS
jgi:hypothetical protein